MMIRRGRTDKPGFSVIEVLIALGMGVVVIASVANAVAAHDRLSNAAILRTQAVGYARQALEIVQTNKDAMFGCSLGSGGSGTCTKDDQTCAVRTGYTSCWTAFPDDATSATHLANGPLHPELTAGVWRLADGAENPIPGTTFARRIDITNLGAGGEEKEVVVTVTWVDNNLTKQTVVRSWLTAWRNF